MAAARQDERLQPTRGGVRPELAPINRTTARAFVAEHHRHNGPIVGDIFRVGLELNGELIAVAVAGRPIAPGMQDGRTIEITRVATLGHENACSRLYGALCRAADALGWWRAITYTLASESGSSVKAAGFERDADVEARNWTMRSGRDRYETNLFGEALSPSEEKVRWVRYLRNRDRYTERAASAADSDTTRKQPHSPTTTRR